MRTTMIGMFILWLCIGQVWAEPKSQLETEVAALRAVLQSSEIAELQLLLDSNRTSYTAEFKVNDSTEKADWDVSYVASAPLEIQVLEFPLEFYLNSGGARYESGSGRIKLNANMSTTLFKAGFAHKADVLQKETKRIRGFLAGLREALTQFGKKVTFGNTIFAFIVCALSFGFLRELKAIRDIKTGKADLTEHAKTREAVNNSLKKFELAANNQELKFDGKLAKLEAKLVERFQATQSPSKNGAGSAKQPLPKPEPAFKKEGLPPRWGSNQEERDNVVEMTRRNPVIDIPTPNTEEEMNQTIEDAAKYHSILDQVNGTARETTSPFVQVEEKVAT